MNNTLTLRPETIQDKAFLEGLYRSTRDDLLQLGLPETMMDNLIQMQFKAQQTGYRVQFPDAAYSIIEKNSMPIGYLIVHHGNESIWLVNIAFMPHERNRGYGRSLIQALQNEAAAADKALALNVAPLNIPAKHLYLSTGFQVVNDDGANLEMIWSAQSNPVFAN